VERAGSISQLGETVAVSEQLDQPIARHEGFNVPGISLFARRFITIVFVTNLLAIAVLLAAILPLGNKAILHSVQNWPSPWCRPWACDRG
jgi:hypothetical protein